MISYKKYDEGLRGTELFKKKKQTRSMKEPTIKKNSCRGAYLANGVAKIEREVGTPIKGGRLINE